MSDLFREQQRSVHEAFDSTGTGARGSAVNRTHRVVREKARAMAAQESRVRSLWIPTAVSSSLLAILLTAVWTVLDQYDVTPTGVPDASNQFLVLCLWFLPLSVAVLAVIFVRRSRRLAESEVRQ